MIPRPGGDILLGFDLDELQGDFVAPQRVRDRSALGAHLRRYLPLAEAPVSVLEGYTTAGGFEILVNSDFAIAA